MRKHIFLWACLLGAVAVLQSGCKKPRLLTLKGAHFAPFFPDPNVRVDVSYIGPPPAPMPEADPITKECGNILFSTMVFRCVDRSGYAEELTGPIADQLKTSLFETRRFTIYDEGAFPKGTLIGFLEGFKTENAKHAIDSSGTGTIDIAIPTKQLKEILESIEKEIDGWLNIIITSKTRIDNDSTSYNVKLQLQLLATANIEDFKILFAREYKIKVSYKEASREIDIDKQEIDRIAQDIKQSFPEVAINKDLKIIDKHDKTITINVGSNKMLSVGMSGHVVRESAMGPFDCRARFIITQVDDNTAKAKLLVNHWTKTLDELIIKQIEVGESIKID